MKRYCAKCSAEITGCNGFVKAGDVLDNRTQPRELCGKCVLMVEWSPHGTLVPQDIAAINAEIRALR